MISYNQIVGRATRSLFQPQKHWSQKVTSRRRLKIRARRMTKEHINRMWVDEFANVSDEFIDKFLKGVQVII